MEKLRVGTIAKSAALKAINPFTWTHIRRLKNNHRQADRTYEDPQLKLYSRLLPHGFLHLGYFDDTSVTPDQISFGDLENAQRRYAEVVLGEITDPSSPVLDVGCGMGAMGKSLAARGFSVVALTPDRNQVAYIEKNIPEISVLPERFESFSIEANEGKFGAILTAESLQYLDLDFVMKAVPRLLKPGGRWVICDYLKTETGSAAHRPTWPALLHRLGEAGLELVSDRDITAHILPTVAFIESLAKRFAVPITEFVSDKVRTKEPGVFYLFQETFDAIENVLNENLKTVTPEIFLREKSYRLVVLKNRSNS